MQKIRTFRLGSLHLELTHTDAFWSQREKNGSSKHHFSLATVILDNGLVMRRIILGPYRIIWTWNNG